MTAEDSTQPLPAQARRTPAPEQRTLPDVDELASTRRAIGLGLVIWPAFFALDVFMCSAVYPEAAIEPFVVYRMLGEVGIVLAWFRVNAPGASRLALVAANGLMCILAAILVSVMALSLGGLASPYMHGISVIVLVEGTAIAAKWQRSLLVTIPTVLAYPLVMALAAVVDSGLMATFTSSTALLAFASNYLFVLASAVIAVVVSHSVWRARRELREARRLSRYRLEAPLGKGGMNDVWLAWDDTLGRQLALKILPSKQLGETTLARFEREARATSQLSSPHTVRVHDFGASDDGIYFIAMEYLQGMDLRALVARHGPVAPARVIHFALQVCRSLTEAHERGIVHRDIKPANLFVTRIDDDEDGVKVLDFGVARVHQPDVGLTISNPGAIVGTPAFVAPETLVGAAADERSDVYSLGATLYDLLTGSPPFSGGTAYAVLVAHLTETPTSPSARLGTPLPSSLEQVVLRCLEKEPSARFGSAKELARALESCADVPRWTVEDARLWWRTASGEHLPQQVPAAESLVPAT